MKSLHNIVSTAGGLVSPKVDARADQPKYSSWLRQCENMIPYRSGALTRAVGTQMISQAKNANTPGHNYAVRLVSFTFSPSTEFMLEFGHHYIRFYSNGLPVQIFTAPLWQVGVFYPPGSFTQDPTNNLVYYTFVGSGLNAQPHTNPAQWIQQNILEAWTPYNADAGSGSIFETDVFTLTPCQINDVVYIVHPSYAPWKLTSVTNTNWTMAPVSFVTPALLDENATNTILTPSGVQGSVIITASAPAWVAVNFYAEGNSVEVAGIIYDCIVSHVSSFFGFAVDLANGKWEQVSIFNAQHVNSVWQLRALRPSAYIEYDGVAATGFTAGTSTSIQCLGSYEVHTYGVWSADIALQRSVDNGITWTTITTITSRSDNNTNFTGTSPVLAIYRFVISNTAALISPGATNPRVVFVCVDAFLSGLVQITEYLGPYQIIGNTVTQLADSNPLSPQWISGHAYSVADKVSYNFINYTCISNVASATPPSQDSPHWAQTAPAGTTYWSEGAWSDYRGYPRAVTSFQQRMIYASSGFEPQRIWATQTNDIENFDRVDPSKATSGFAFDLNAPSRGPILWLIAQADLFAGFSGAEWVINSGSAVGTSVGGAITPTNINAVEQGTFGSAPFVIPVIVGNAVFFAQRQADAIRQMLFSIYTSKYMSQDLTSLSDNLFSSGIVQLAYQSRWRHQGILWAVTQQGSLCGLTYDLDQEVFGWCLRRTGFNQKDLNGNSIVNDNGFESVASLYGNDTSDDELWVVANRLIDGVQTRFIERVNPNNWEENFISAPNNPEPNLSEAYYVDCGLIVSSPGSLTITGLNYLEGRLVIGLADGTKFGPLLVESGEVMLPSTIPTTVEIVNIGLPIPYVGQPMRIDADGRAGNTQALVKQISDVYLRVWNSMGGLLSNGTENYPLWVSGDSYVVGDNVISPETLKAYQCVVDYNGATDPSEVPGSWQETALPFFRQPVPIPYTNSQANPFAVPQLVTTPTDIRLTPQGDKTPSNDPVFIVTGSDALPLTVLGWFLKYEITGVP